MDRTHLPQELGEANGVGGSEGGAGAGGEDTVIRKRKQYIYFPHQTS